MSTWEVDRGELMLAFAELDDALLEVTRKVVLMADDYKWAEAGHKMLEGY